MAKIKLKVFKMYLRDVHQIKEWPSCVFLRCLKELRWYPVYPLFLLKSNCFLSCINCSSFFHWLLQMPYLLTGGESSVRRTFWQLSFCWWNLMVFQKLFILTSRCFVSAYFQGQNSFLFNKTLLSISYLLDITQDGIDSTVLNLTI